MESFIFSLSFSTNCSPASEPPESGGTDDASLPARQSAAGWISAKSLSSSSYFSVYSSFFLISQLQDETDAPSNYLQILQSKIPPKRKKISAFPVCSQQESVQSPVIYEKRLFTKKLPIFVLPISSDCNPLKRGRDQTCFFDPIILHKKIYYLFLKSV